MVLAEPIHEKAIGTINRWRLIFGVHGLQRHEPGVEGLLGHPLPDNIKNFGPKCVEIRHKNQAFPFTLQSRYVSGAGCLPGGQHQEQKGHPARLFKSYHQPRAAGKPIETKQIDGRTQRKPKVINTGGAVWITFCIQTLVIPACWKISTPTFAQQGISLRIFQKPPKWPEFAKLE